MTALDLDAIKARAEAVNSDRPICAPDVWQITGADIPALVAEVERLRALHTEECHCVPYPYGEGPDQSCPRHGDVRWYAALALCDEARVLLSLGPVECDQSCDHGPCECGGSPRPWAWSLNPTDLRAALSPQEGT